MKDIEDKIMTFAHKEENIQESLALLKVGVESGDSPEIVMLKLMTSILFRFHGIPINKQNG